MENYEMESSSNPEPGGRNLPEPRSGAWVGIVVGFMSGRQPEGQLGAQEDQADQG
jgi:hypothetical protein